jgi:hypothetical protein
MPVDLLYQRGCEIHGRETLDIEQRGAFDKIVERRGADLYGGRIDREGRVAFCRLVEVDQQTTAIVRKATMRRRKAYGADRESDRGPGLVYLPSLCLNCAYEDRHPNDTEEARDRFVGHFHAPLGLEIAVSIPEEARCGSGVRRSEPIFGIVPRRRGFFTALTKPAPPVRGQHTAAAVIVIRQIVKSETRAGDDSSPMETAAGKVALMEAGSVRERAAGVYRRRETA